MSRGRIVALLRRRAFLIAALAGVSAGQQARAQNYAGPYVPLGSRLDQLVGWEIAEGAFPTLDPLSRPYRLAAVRRAVDSTDTLRLAPAGRRALGWLREELAGFDRPRLVVGEAALDAYNNGRRDSFRPGGGSGVQPAAGFWVSMASGPFTAVVNPAMEGRLYDDPEYTGDKTKKIAGRMQSAYVAASGELGDLFVGRMARDWGPGLFDGLLISPSAYEIESFAGSLRIGRFELSTIAQQLDRGPDTTGAPGVAFNRFLFAHRLGINLGRGSWLAFYETGVYGGAGQGFRPAFLNPVNLGLLSEVNDSENVNILVGADFTAQTGAGFVVGASAFIDDIQISRGTLRDQRPTSYSLTLVLRRRLSSVPVHLALGYTRVSSLAYRNEKDVRLSFTLTGIGLGRNYSDYDQLLLRAEYRPGRSWYAAADLSYMRQGSYDFHQPFPSDSVLAQPGQGFLVAPVQSSGGARLTVGAEPRAGLELRAEVGVTGRPNGGGSGAETIASASVHLQLDLLAGALGGAVHAVEPGANRAWP